jgi:WD40 repeat protein
MKMLNQTISHYRILEPLGASGMGEIYKAEDLELKRTVALKFLPQELLADNSTKQHLLDEAQAAAALNHPHIATIYELEQSDELSYIVMEYIEGETLKSKTEQGGLDVERVIDIAIQIAEALRATHERGLIHCDIKSSNIMLTVDSSVKVLDFGLARLAVTKGTGSAMGTLGYMSPEQARGEQLDGRTDIFSLGIVLYQMLTGCLPFDGIHPLLNSEPAAIGSYREDVPLELESIVRRALEKDRDERYQTAGEMLLDLKRLRERIAQGGAGRESQSDDSLQSIPVNQPLWQRLLPFLYRRGTEAIRSVPKGAAFRGLLPFQEADRDRFYGREMETLSLFDMISHNDFRFGVLFGESGCGKTSLIRAGLLPRLWEEGYVPVYCRSYKDPLAALMRELRKQSQIECEGDEQPINYLGRIAEEMSAGIVIICDQFEEFFINFRTKSEREPFISFVTACYHTDAPVKFLFSMRGDFLYLISPEFDERIPNPLSSSRLYHLSNFDEEQALVIIERSAWKANLQLEPGLGRQVAKDLAANGVVLPSELQIVGEQLQIRRIFTLEEYRRSSGKETLVHNFLEDVVRATGDRNGSYLLLRSLISDENMRLTLPIEEIARRTQQYGEKIKQIIKLFVQARLIREIQEDEPWRYELMHEYLIEKINQITGKVMDATQRANRLFRQYLSSYSIDRRTRIPIGKLWSINRYSDLKRSERERELLRKSLRWGVLKGSILFLLLSVVVVLTAATLSVSEQWESARLSDGHMAAVRRAAFSPDGRRLVSGDEKATLIVWDFAKRERVATITEHSGPITAIAFSPDGKWLATGSQDCKVIIWDAQNLKKIVTLNEHNKRIAGAGFSPDGRYLVTTLEGGRAIVWEVPLWKKKRELILEMSNDILFLENGRHIIESNGREWDLTTGEELNGALDSGGMGIYGAALSPDATCMVGVDSDGVVHFIDLEQRKNIGNYRVHEDNGRAVAFSPYGRLVATGAENIALWDVATRTKLLRFEYSASVWSLTFSPDGRWLISTHEDGAILVWDVNEREQEANFNEHSAPVRKVEFSSNGRWLASASEDRSVILWDLEMKKKVAVLEGHSMRVTALALSPDGRSVASSDYNRSLIIWDISERRPRWSSYIGTNYCLTYSPDGRWIATSSRVLDSNNGIEVLRYGQNMYGIAFSADGRRLASVTPDNGGEIFIWDTEKWKLLKKLQPGNTKLLNASFSPDGKLLATGDEEGRVQLWTTEPLAHVALLGRHNGRVKSVAFSTDGRRVASGSDDQTISLWDVQSRRLVTNIGSHISPVLSVAFSPDGRLLASGERDRTIRIHTRYRILWGYRLD